LKARLSTNGSSEKLKPLYESGELHKTRDQDPPSLWHGIDDELKSPPYESIRLKSDSQRVDLRRLFAVPKPLGEHAV